MALDFLVSGPGRLTTLVEPKIKKLETFTEKIRGTDEESAAVARKAGLALVCERIKTVVIEIVVIAGVKRGTGVWVPAEKELAADV